MYARSSCRLSGWADQVIEALPEGSDAEGWKPKKWHKLPLPQRHKRIAGDVGMYDGVVGVGGVSKAAAEA